MQPNPNQYQQQNSMFSRAETHDLDNMMPPSLTLSRGQGGIQRNQTQEMGMNRQFTGMNEPYQPMGLAGNQMQHPMYGHSQTMGQQPMMGQNNMMGRQKSADDVLQAMATKINQQGRMINTINDYFAHYDAHEQRLFESWELALMFQETINRDDAETFCRSLSSRMGPDASINYPVLLNSLAQKLPQIPQGVPGRQSVFITKFKSPQITQYLSQIQNCFRMKGLSIQQGYDQNFHSPYITYQDFQRFLMSANIQIQSFDLNQLYQYFQIGNESTVNKICFVQALQQSGSQQPLNHLQTITSMGSMDSYAFSTMQQPSHNDPMTKFLQAIKEQMQMNRGLSFEGILSRYNIPYQPYIEITTFEELCLKLRMTFTQNELNTIVNQLDEDRIYKVKTQALRNKVEQFLNSMTQQHSINQPGTIEHQNSYHINQSPIRDNTQYDPRNQAFGINPQPTQAINRPYHIQDMSSSPQLQPMLDKISQFLESINKTDLRQLFTISIYQNKEVVELQEFLNFLQGHYLNFTSNQAYQIAQQFLINTATLGYKPLQYIDINEFGNKLFANKQPIMDLQQQRHNSYQTLNKIYDSIRKYIMVNGGNIQKFFMESDLNKDNFISKAELKISLEKIGYLGITEHEVNQVFQLFDNNQDGRISYQELCKQFSEFSNTKAIKDQSHPQFYIFESIRKAVNNTQQSLSTIFGLNNLHINTLQDKIPLRKDQFFQTLARLNIPISYQNEQKLLELLDADQSPDINFAHFAELVGLHYQPIEYENIANQYIRSPLTSRTFTHQRDFYRQLFDVTQNRNITIGNLKMIFVASDNMKSGTIQLNDMVTKLKEIDQDNILDIPTMKDACQKFTQPNGMFNYRSFLDNLAFQLEKYKIINLIFIALNSAMQKQNLHQLYQLFQQFDLTGMKQFDKLKLNDILLRYGINLNQHELDMVLLEYDPQYGGQKLDFNMFENDFMEFQKGKSRLNAFVDRRHVQYNDFNNYIKGNQNMISEPAIKRQPTTLIKEIFRKIGNYLDSAPNIKITEALMEHDITRSGLLNINNFQTILQRNLFLSTEESQHLVYHYDPQSRQQIKIADFLMDLKDYVTNTAIRLNLLSISQELGSAPGSTGMNLQDPKFALQRYTKDFEDIQKAIFVHKSDTFQWFQNYSSLNGKQSITRNDFRSAIQALNLQNINTQDLDAIFDNLDTNHKGQVEIFAVDDSIRRNSKLTSVQMQEEVIEKIARGFNGDDAYILRELLNLDPSKRGLVDSAVFVNYFMKNSPQHLKFTAIDLQFIAMKYTQMGPNIVDINQFHDDFKRVRQSRGIQAGHYSGSHIGGPNSMPGYNDNQRKHNDFGGHRNPLLPQHSGTNTLSENQGTQPHASFRLNLEPNYLQEIAKASYVKEKQVYDYFSQFSQKSASGELLQETDFIRAIQNLGVNWTSPTVSKVFSELDIAFNGGSRKLYIQPTEVDQAVHWFSKKGFNLRGEITVYESGSYKQISLDNMKDLLLNRLRIPQLDQSDIQFMCKRYIMNMPNQVQYEKFLDDIDIHSRFTYSNVNNFKSTCDYIRKACHLQKSSVDEHFKKYLRQQNLLSNNEFLQACTHLALIPEACNESNIEKLFQDIDSAHSSKVTVPQVSAYISKNSTKNTKELQDDIVEDITTKANAKSIMVDTIFNKEDPMSRGIILQHTFVSILQRTFMVKDIDAKFLSMRYMERGENVSYKLFNNDVNLKLKDHNIGRGKTQVGLPGYNQNELPAPHQQRLKQILIRINDYVVQNNLSIVSKMSQYERGMSSGTIPQHQFLQALEQLNVPIVKDELYFVSENYMVNSANSMGGQQGQVDYRKFLEDIKFYASSSHAPKTVQSLTKEQSDFYKNLINHMKQNNKQNGLVQSIQDRDTQRKGYLSQKLLRDSFIENSYEFDSNQLNTLFSAIDTNSIGEHNIMQLYEILFGPQEAQRVFNGGSAGGHRQDNQQTVKFVMPQQPIGASNAILSQIGKKIIQSNINYEEEIKKRIGHNQAQSPTPKATEMELLDVLQVCKVNLTSEERIEFQALVANKQDAMRMIPVLDFLQALGLPPQTLGTRGLKTLPKKILQPNDLKFAQEIITKLRVNLQQMGKKPEDVFEKCKSSIKDVSIPMIQFKLVLASEFGQVGKSLTDNHITLLTYYLTSEVPGEISYKKLYLAFTLTDKDPPLAQEGADEIRRYETKIRDQARQGVPLEIIDLLHFFRQSGLTMPQIFKQTQKGLIGRQEFETCMKEIGYQAKDPLKLIELLDTKGTRTSVSLDKLNDYIRKSSQEKGSITPQIARDRYKGFDPKVRQYLQKISDYLKRGNVTLQKMYEEMDVNRDGTVDKMEFVSKLSYLNIPGIQLSDLGMIFDAIDINNDNSLSLNEFGMFIEGAKATRMQRQQDLDPKLLDDMKREIQTLFQQFDDNGDGYVTADEIFKSMMALGQRITLEDAANMVKQIDTNGDGRLDQREFVELMLPKMKDELLNQEDSLEDLRAMFLDADIDHSGTLSVDEIYSVLLKMGAEVTIEEIIELMNEIDVDRDGSLDIDEFIALMNMGDEIQFRSAQAKNTYINIKKARKLNPLDFFKCFKNMPINFVPSFFQEQWVKKRKNLPSSVFMPQIDPKTMLYKDLYPLLSENIAPNQTTKAMQPRLRPLHTELGCQILLESAQGIPIPASNQGFDRNNIVKRAVRIGLYDTVKKDFIFNAVQVNALYNQSDEDVWSFNAWRENGTNPVLFKTSNKDEIVKPTTFLIFELVVYVKVGERITEMSCGWSELELHHLDRPMTHKLPIKGGSPNAEVLIKDTDVHTNRTGMKYLIKVMGTKITSQLTVSIRNHQKFTDETKFHLDLLPSTCLIQKRLLYLVSGFRNYIGEKLLKQSSMSSFRHPEGDVIISTFPKILDNPDICEQLINIWSEDVWSTMSNTQKYNVELIMLRTKEFISKLYPVLYADEFGFKESNTTMSAAGDQYLTRKREELIKSALRYGNPQAKVKVDKPIELMSTFKPFTVKELEFEVWDTTQAKQDRFLRQYEDLGLLNADQQPMQNLGGGHNNMGLSNNMGMIGSQGGVLQPMNMNNQQQQLPYGQARSLGSALNNAFN